MTRGSQKGFARMALFVLLSLLVLAAAFLFAFQTMKEKARVAPASRSVETSELKDGMVVRMAVGSAQAAAEVVRSAGKRTQGLSGRESLPEDTGMLFVFEEKGAWAFWNKDMRFALDLIWIDGDTVVDVRENLPAFADAPVALTPQAEANIVLEVNAGFVKAHSIQKGDKVQFFAN